MSPIKVAIAKPDWPKYPASQAQLDLWAHLGKRYGIQFTVFSTRGLGSYNTFLPVRPLRRLNPVSFFPSYPGLLGCLAGHDVIITADPTIFSYAWWSALGARLTRAKLVVDTSMTLPLPMPTSARNRAILWVSRRVLKQAWRIVVPTALTTQRFVRMGLIEEGCTKVVEMGHPVDTARFRAAPVSATREHIILSVGRLVPEKGHDVIIRALADLLRTQRARLFIAGDGPSLPSHVALCEELQISDRVVFLGDVPRKDLPAVYNRASIFVHHPLTTQSWEEFFGVAVVEAMSSGLPIVASDCGALKLVMPHQAGFLVSQRDGRMLAERVESLLDNPSLRAEMGAFGRAHVCSRYSLTEIGRRYYERVLTG